MASGHVNRIKRPNTWLHRPMLQNVKKALANSEPSTHGTLKAAGKAFVAAHRGCIVQTPGDSIGQIGYSTGPQPPSVGQQIS